MIIPDKYLTFFALIVLLTLLNLSPVLSQYIDQQNFTKEDSLRAKLNKFRSCFDVKYYDLSVTPGLHNHSIIGKNQITVEAIQDFDRIQLDLFSNMLIDSVVYNGKILSFERVKNAFFIQFPRIINKGVIIQYNNLSFTPAMAKLANLLWNFVWTILGHVSDCQAKSYTRLLFIANNERK